MHTVSDNQDQPVYPPAFQKEEDCFADVILPLNLPQMLTYGIPEHLRGSVLPGMRVEVSLGKNRQYSGIVYRLHQNRPEKFRVRPVKRLIDTEPIVSGTQLRFWSWIATYYMAAPGEVMQAALPAHLKLSGETRLRWKGGDVDLNWSDEAYPAAEALSIHGELSFSELRTIVGQRKMHEVIYELLEKEAVEMNETLESSYKPKKEKFVSMTPQYKEEEQLSALFQKLEKAPRQLDLLMTWITLAGGSDLVRQQELMDKSNATGSQLKAMIDKGIFLVTEHDPDRFLFDQDQLIKELCLSPAQEQARQEWLEKSSQKQVVLLQGVTGSGKTLLYIDAIKACLQEGRQALLLLPEIGLTTQLVRRLYNYFGAELGVYHSRFSNNERMEVWEKVRKGQYKVIAGPRSALWLPYSSLGVLVVDEEHDGSYKQKDPAPRFHARDVAIYLAGLYGAKVLLGSATPSLESLHHARTGKYGYVQLKERYQGVQLPEIVLVPAGAQAPGGNALLTAPLQDAIRRALDQKKQVVLFRNRRGYAPFLMCSVCGWVPHCKNCAVSLTYHKTTDRLHCHYCGLKSTVIHTCPSCGSNRIREKAAGTEKVEEEVRQLFPQARVARMDIDSMRGKERLSRLLDDLGARKVDVLVGTQMVVKGLDFPMVALVGILNADSLFSFPDFRVNERAFQLMEQVSGRAGRADGAGQVFIQVHQQAHPVLKWVMRHDVDLFYEEEIVYRKNYGYPPFSRLLRVSCRHRDEAKAKFGAGFFTEALQKDQRISVQGPVTPLVGKIRNLFYQEVWIKCPHDGAVRSAVKKHLLHLRDQLTALRGYSNVQVIFDVDPV